MNYFKEDRNKIARFDVTMDENYLRMLIPEIIIKAGNKKSQSILAYKNSNYSEGEVPYLVLLIERVLNGDTSAIDELLYPSVQDLRNLPDFHNEIKHLLKKIKECRAAGANVKENYELKQLVTKLVYFQEEKEFNAKQIPIKIYYAKVCSTLRFTYVNSIKIKDLEKYRAFINDMQPNNEAQSLKMLLNKRVK